MEKRYYYLIGSELRTKTDEGNPDAIERVNKKGITVFEKSTKFLFGIIKDITFFDGQYGKNLNIGIEHDDALNILSLPASSREAEDIMRRLPNLDFSSETRIGPYRFEEEGKKPRYGMSVYQQDGDGKYTKRIDDYYFDFINKRPINGAPEIDWKTASETDRKIYFLKLNEFLITKTLEVINKMGTVDYPSEELDPTSVPF